MGEVEEEEMAGGPSGPFWPFPPSRRSTQFENVGNLSSAAIPEKYHLWCKRACDRGDQAYFCQAREAAPSDLRYEVEKPGTSILTENDVADGKELNIKSTNPAAPPVSGNPYTIQLLPTSYDASFPMIYLDPSCRQLGY